MASVATFPIDKFPIDKMPAKRLARLTAGKRLTRMSSDLLTSDVGVARHGLAQSHARILLVPAGCGFSPETERRILGGRLHVG